VKATSGFVKHVKETYAVLLSRPWWTYGAEMGVNEHGVVMGNVAVFTREPYKDSGLLGMDILRLTLERSRSAREALEVVIELTESPGQGGNYSYEKPFRYHNSYLIVDSSEAWIIESAGEFWAAKRVSDVYSASNALTISDD
ncbi:MAG: C69 family dipeptidase, partial [Desulfurococcus sp.]|nr:C69 family dipeptidase [Desulfurococcus sp.]